MNLTHLTPMIDRLFLIDLAVFAVIIIAVTIVDLIIRPLRRP